MTLDTSVDVNVNVKEKLLLYSILFAKKDQICIITSVEILAANLH